MNKKINELIKKSGIAIENGTNQPEIADALLPYGYTPERMTEGKGHLDEASRLNSKQIQEDAQQQAATKELNLAIEEANKEYIPLLKIARIAFKNDSNRWVQFQLSGARETNQADWLTQTNVFYNNLLVDEDAQAKMALFGQTKEKLEAGFELVKKVEQKLALRKKEMGDAQSATNARNKAADLLQNWYEDYIEISRLALAEQPQYLEMLGIVEPS
ncbi:hypothetical protein [Carboxylicivirga linearis]|uniref:Uncharacterized protein n=1 Tax=Carboxylicivirga linearis TaxID=1628157 RepID=A0ABS5K072_9BACT|nr:hypothetical protein [Carboxylicivirga linearis]MBS2100489.1 hypothetical protein [Carboxylicivirga linearis]